MSLGWKGHETSVMLRSLRSAGLLPYRIRAGIEVLVAHPGGPYFAHRDNGWWSIVKGIVEEAESDTEAAAREFSEETGWPAPAEPWIPLGETVLRSRKTVVAWAAVADYDPAALDPGTFRMGGREYPEIDRVAWLEPEEAMERLNTAQQVFVTRLLDHLDL